MAVTAADTAPGRRNRQCRFSSQQASSWGESCSQIGKTVTLTRCPSTTARRPPPTRRCDGGTSPWPARSTRPGSAARDGCSASSTPASSCSGRAESGKEFTVQEVVDRSGQSLRSFYQYFAGKHELLLALFDEAIRSTADRLEEQIAQAGHAARAAPRASSSSTTACACPAPKGRTSKNNPTPVHGRVLPPAADRAPDGGGARLRPAGDPAREGARRRGRGRGRAPAASNTRTPRA